MIQKTYLQLWDNILIWGRYHARPDRNALTDIADGKSYRKWASWFGQLTFKQPAALIINKWAPMKDIASA